MQKILENIALALRALYPILYIKTTDEVRAISLIKEAASELGLIVFSYDEVDGVKWLNENSIPIDKKNFLRIKNQLGDYLKNFYEALSFVRDISSFFHIVLIVLSADNLLDETNPEARKHIRFLKNLINELKTEDRKVNFAFISSKVTLPELLEKEALIIEFPYPNRKEIEAILDNFLATHNLVLNKNLKKQFIAVLQGLSREEIENLLQLTIANDGKLNADDLDLLVEYQKHLIIKNPVIEYLDLRKEFIKLGGFKNFKKWLKRKRKIFENLDKALRRGVDLPKGIFLFGMPGCGKSLAAKYVAKELNLPLLRLDIGRIIGPYLGQSEENLRKALHIAETLSPCVLWIDEIEKAFGPLKGSTSIHDTILRIFGTLLTWMQEKKEPVMVVATANDISGIPPELLRKGRFDKIFFVDFPEKEEMVEIFKYHLEKRGQSTSGIDFKKILKKMKKGYSGADIEAIVAEAVEKAFLENRAFITTEDILEIIENETIKPTSEVLKSKIKELEKLFETIQAEPVN